MEEVIISLLLTSRAVEVRKRESVEWSRKKNQCEGRKRSMVDQESGLEAKAAKLQRLQQAAAVRSAGSCRGSFVGRVPRAHLLEAPPQFRATAGTSQERQWIRLAAGKK